MSDLLRWSVAITLVLLVPVIPFLGFGGPLEARVESWFDSRLSHSATAAIVVGALASDILLPIPSSFVSTLAGSRLGLVGGTGVVWLGMTLGAVTGFASRAAFRSTARAAALVDRRSAPHGSAWRAGWSRRLGTYASVAGASRGERAAIGRDRVTLAEIPAGGPARQSRAGRGIRGARAFCPSRRKSDRRRSRLRSRYHSWRPRSPGIGCRQRARRPDCRDLGYVLSRKQTLHEKLHGDSHPWPIWSSGRVGSQRGTGRERAHARRGATRFHAAHRRNASRLAQRRHLWSDAERRHGLASRRNARTAVRAAQHAGGHPRRRRHAHRAWLPHGTLGGRTAGAGGGA